MALLESRIQSRVEENRPLVQNWIALLRKLTDITLALKLSCGIRPEARPKMRFLTDSRIVPRSYSTPRMRVIAAGLPRCATSSIQKALESPTLGFWPCMHMAHIFPHPDREILVNEAMRCILTGDTSRRRQLLHALYDDYAATADFPSVLFFDDLLDMYPEAVVILNQRQSADAWSRSVRDSLGWFDTRQYRWICFLWRTNRLHWEMHLLCKAIVKQRYGIEDLAAKEFYNLHNDWVHAEAMKRGRAVLVFRAEMGYEPLCEFLGMNKPQNEVQFPHLNDGAAMKRFQRALIARGLISWAALCVIMWTGFKFSLICLRRLQ